MATSGSRFALLDGRASKSEKKEKKEKKEQKEDGAKDKKDKKEKKSKGEDEDDAAKLKNASALHVLIVTVLSGKLESYSQKDCVEACAWLNLDIELSELGTRSGTVPAFVAQKWPKMLKTVARAIEDGGAMTYPQLAELWAVGPRLDDPGFRNDDAKKLRSVLESKFNHDLFFQQAWQARQQQKVQAPRQEPPPAPDVIEPSLCEKRLELFGQAPTFSSSDGPTAKCVAERVLNDEARRCFAFHWPKLFSENSIMYLEQLQEDAPWQKLERSDGTAKRSTCWYVRQNCTCDYTYGSDRVRMQGQDEGCFADLMEKLTKEVFHLARPDWPEEDFPNSANLNLYQNGSEAVGWHADDESLFAGKDDDCLIVSLSLGATREFWLAPRGESVGEALRPDEDYLYGLELRNGDLMTMEGLVQKHYLHCVPSGKTAQPRINVTWRWIRNHKRGCPLHVARSGHDED